MSIFQEVWRKLRAFRFRVALVMFLLTLGLRGSWRTPAAEPELLASPLLLASPRVPAGRVSSSLKMREAQLPLSAAERTDRRNTFWDAFAQKFGRDLEPEFSDAGLLLFVKRRVIGSPHGIDDVNEASIAESSVDFVFNEGGVLKLSNQVLADLLPFLGTASETPLQVTSIRMGPQSAQVFYQQTLAGLPLVPGGSVRVDLGSQGKLSGVDLDTVPGVQPLGQFLLSQADVQLQAAQLLGARSMSDPEKIYWVSSASTARAAYRIGSMGKELIVDAETGRVLSQRTRRQD